MSHNSTGRYTGLVWEPQLRHGRLLWLSLHTIQSSFSGQADSERADGVDMRWLQGDHGQSHASQERVELHRSSSFIEQPDVARGRIQGQWQGKPESGNMYNQSETEWASQSVGACKGLKAYVKPCRT